MASANNDVAAALDSVLSDETETQAVETQSPDVATKDIVEQAVAEALKSQSPPASDESAEEKGGKTPKTVPYERFSEVVGQKNDAGERLNALDTQFKQSTEREETLKTRVGELEQEHQILEAIRGLAQDERYTDAVNKIDRALQGIEEEAEKAEEAGDEQKLSQVEKRFTEKSEELEDLIADQRAESLFEKANDYASAMLDSLPEEYTDEDKARLGREWTPRVPWDNIEAEGETAIPANLKSSFAELIKDYGTPQGAVVNKTRTEIEKAIPKDALESTRSPEAIVKAATEKDWAEVGEEGKIVHSDDDFAADLAKVLRATNNR